MAGIDAVVHAAGLAHVRHNVANSDFEGINARGTANVVQAAAAAGVQRFVLISSISVYGQHAAELLDETATCWPDSAYGASKLKAELSAAEAAVGSSMQLSILRLGTVFGEGDPGNVGRLLETIRRRRFIWIGDGRNRKSLIYKDDVGRACLAVLRSDSQAAAGTFNVSGDPCQLREVVNGLADALGVHVPSWYVPGSWALAAGRCAATVDREGRGAGLYQTIRRWLADEAYSSQRFSRTFDFRTQVSLQEGLRRQVASARQGQ